MSVIMHGGPCDRCGEARETRPYKWSTVVYRGKTLEKPWRSRRGG